MCMFTRAHVNVSMYSCVRCLEFVNDLLLLNLFDLRLLIISPAIKFAFFVIVRI